MNYFESNKRYLDHNGLKALILKIKELYDKIQTNDGDIKTLRDDLAALIQRVEEEAIPELRGLINALRNELGNDKSNPEPETVYARLKEAEAAIKALDNRATNLEGRVDAIDNDAVSGIDHFEYVPAEKKIKLGLKTKNIDKDQYEAEIDVTDFVIDGMIQDVKLVTVTKVDDVWQLVVNNHPGGNNLGYEVINRTEYNIQPDLTPEWFDAHPDHKFLMMIFNCDTDGNSELVAGSKPKAILIETNALFNDYKFFGNVSASDETYNDYVSLTVTETPGDANNVNKVTYSLKLNEDLVNDLKLVEGSKSGDLKGIVDLNNELSTVNSNIDALEDRVTDDEKAIEQLRKELGTAPAEETPDVYTRLNAAEGNIHDVEEWINKQSIPVDQLNVVFDKIVYGKDMPETSYDWFDPATDLETGSEG